MGLSFASEKSLYGSLNKIVLTQQKVTMRKLNSPISPLGSTMKAAASGNQPKQVGSNPVYRVNNPPGNMANNNRKPLGSAKDKTFDSPSDKKRIKMKPSSGDRGYVPKR